MPNPHGPQAEHVGDATVIRFTDVKTIDEKYVREFLNEDFIALIEQHGPGKIIFDLGTVEFLSSAALGKLITLQRKIKDRGGRLILTSVVPDLYEVFEITKLTKIFTIKRLGGDNDPDAETTGATSPLKPPKPSDSRSAALRPPTPEENTRPDKRT
jgi:anti-sigma B factor antagonist